MTKWATYEMFGRVHNDIYMLGSKDLSIYVFKTLMYIVGKPWSK